MSGERITLTDMDLHVLFRDAPRYRAEAKELVSFVKALAGGKARFRVRQRTLCKRLGWSESKYHRVRRVVEEAGVKIVRLPGSHGGDLANLWVLDRRSIEGLVGPSPSLTDGHSVVADVAPPKGDENSSLSPAPSELGEREETPSGAQVASAAGELATATSTASSATMAERSDDPGSGAPHERPGLPVEALEPELSELRRWVRQRAGQSSTGSGAELVELLERGRRFLELDGRSTFKLLGAVAELERELRGEGQLELGEGAAA